METANIWGDEIPTGIIYQARKETYDEKFSFLGDKEPMIDRKLDPKAVEAIINRMK